MDTRENWAEAGLICGHAFADETIKLAALAEIDEELDKVCDDKEAAGKLLELAGKVIQHPALRMVGGAGLAGAGGLALGKKQERSQANQEMAAVAPDIFRAGFEQGARQGFQHGARAGFMHAKQQEAGA
jgi:hypothetical protein